MSSDSQQGATMGDAVMYATNTLKNTGEKIAKGIKPVPPLYYMVPGLIAALIVAIILLITLPFSGYGEINVCTEGVCEMKPYNNIWNVGWVLFGAFAAGIVIGATVRQILFYYYNPYIAAVGMAKNTVFN